MTVAISGQWDWNFSNSIILGQVTHSAYVKIYLHDNSSGAVVGTTIFSASRTCTGVILKGVVCLGSGTTGSGAWNQRLSFSGVYGHSYVLRVQTDAVLYSYGASGSTTTRGIVAGGVTITG